MQKKLKLKQKFTILSFLILIVGVSFSGITLATVLNQNAKDEMTSKALSLIDTISSVREYTITQITPELMDDIKTKFLPQAVSEYSAREVFEILRKKPEYRNFFYKEATLNPTNLRDKADSFETRIVEDFKKNKKLKQVTGFRSLPSGDVFYLARPLAVTKEICLTCHSTPDAAPKTMIERYGTANGFNWHLNDIVATQMVSLPASGVIKKVNQSLFISIGLVSALFVAVILLVNFFLNREVVVPLKRITRVAEEVSTGYMDVDFEPLTNDEIGNLAKAFKQMKRSLDMVMKTSKVTNRDREL